MYLDKSLATDGPIPWSTLRYLIGEAMYGGRVTDDYDRRILVTYLEEYMGDFIFDSYQPFYFCQVGFDYAIPPPSQNPSVYMDYIKVRGAVAGASLIVTCSSDKAAELALIYTCTCLDTPAAKED